MLVKAGRTAVIFHMKTITCIGLLCLALVCMLYGASASIGIGEECTGRNYRECVPAVNASKCQTYYCNKEVSPYVCAVKPSISATGKACGFNNLGACQMGVLACNETTGKLVCAGAIDPVPEVEGDGIDNNCDGVVL